MIDIYDNDKPQEETPPRKKDRAMAVALEHTFGADVLPKITAAGYGVIAEQIVQIAFDNGVKVREDADLAALLAALEIDSDIPSEALIAVAEILSYVYKANGTYHTDKQKNDQSSQHLNAQNGEETLYDSE